MHDVHDYMNNGSQVDTELKEMLSRCEEKYKCSVVRCHTGRLVKGQAVWVALRSRINSSVLNEVSNDSWTFTKKKSVIITFIRI